MIKLGFLLCILCFIFHPNCDHLLSTALDGLFHLMGINCNATHENNSLIPTPSQIRQTIYIFSFIRHVDDSPCLYSAYLHFQYRIGSLHNWAAMFSQINWKNHGSRQWCFFAKKTLAIHDAKMLCYVRCSGINCAGAWIMINNACKWRSSASPCRTARTYSHLPGAGTPKAINLNSSFTIILIIIIVLRHP